MSIGRSNSGVKAENRKGRTSIFAVLAFLSEGFLQLPLYCQRHLPQPHGHLDPGDPHSWRAVVVSAMRSLECYCLYGGQAPVSSNIGAAPES